MSQQQRDINRHGSNPMLPFPFKRTPSFERSRIMLRQAVFCWQKAPFWSFSTHACRFSPSPGTMMLRNESDMSLAVGGMYFSGIVEKPAAILSRMSFRTIGGTLSSVALTVRRTICAASS